MVAPAATPDAAIRRLSEALAQVMASAAIRARLIEIGVEPLFQGAAEFGALMAADRAYWVPMIRELGITLDT
jgi:tripartite-type tricarboxylate transporter receptor subunit TctC